MNKLFFIAFFLNLSLLSGWAFSAEPLTDLITQGIKAALLREEPNDTEIQKISEIISDYMQPLRLSSADKPEVLLEYSETAYSKISFADESKWPCNGRFPYKILGLDDWKLVKKVIIDAQKAGRSQVTIVDIGAGNFYWVDIISAAIVREPDITVQVSCIGVRGEKYTDPNRQCTTEKNCTVYRRGNFKLEGCIAKEFQLHGLDIQEGIDLAISSMTLCHLVTPVDTVQELINILRPDSGLLLSGMFFFLYDGQENGELRMGELRPKFLDKNLLTLLWDAAQPFLAGYTPNADQVGFIVRRTSDARVILPITYSLKQAEKYIRGNPAIYVRDPGLPQRDVDGCVLAWPGHIAGDKRLFNELMGAGLLREDDDTPWDLKVIEGMGSLL